MHICKGIFGAWKLAGRGTILPTLLFIAYQALITFIVIECSSDTIAVPQGLIVVIWVTLKVKFCGFLDLVLSWHRRTTIHFPLFIKLVPNHLEDGLVVDILLIVDTQICCIKRPLAWIFVRINISSEWSFEAISYILI